MTSPQYFSRIAGIGTYLPEKCLTNKDLETFVDTTDEWIVKRTGVTQRFIAAEGEGTADMAAAAARRALEAANVDASEIELVIVATHYPDMATPSVACLVQQMLGIKQGFAYDLNAACTGFVYALGNVDAYIRCGQIKKALIIGADRLSQVIRWQERGTAVLFGDGAGAAVVEVSNEPGVLSVHLRADGAQRDSVYINHGTPVYEPMSEANRVVMNGPELFKQAVRGMSSIVKEALEKNNFTADDIDWIIPHQANVRIVDATVKASGIAAEKAIVTVGQHANTSAATIPRAMEAGLLDGRIKRGQHLMFTAAGGGLTWGSALLRY